MIEKLTLFLIIGESLGYGELQDVFCICDICHECSFWSQQLR